MGQEKKKCKSGYQGKKKKKKKHNIQTEFQVGKFFKKERVKWTPSLGNCLVSQILLRQVWSEVMSLKIEIKSPYQTYLHFNMDPELFYNTSLNL